MCKQLGFVNRNATPVLVPQLCNTSLPSLFLSSKNIRCIYQLPDTGRKAGLKTIRLCLDRCCFSCLFGLFLEMKFPMKSFPQSLLICYFKFTIQSFSPQSASLKQPSLILSPAVPSVIVSFRVK